MFSKIVKHLLITVLMVCMCLFTVYGPYYLTFAFSKGYNEGFELGIHYWYLGREIYSDLCEMNGTFKTIKVMLDIDTENFNSYLNNQTDLFFRLAKQLFNFKVAVIVWYDKIDKLSSYLNRWGKYVDYIQVLNEPDIAKAWGLNGSLYMDEEIYAMASRIVESVRSFNSEHNANIKTYTNFTPAILVRTSLVKVFENITDFIGLDMYYTLGVFQLTPFVYQCLSKLVKGKEVIISEFGVCEYNDDVQAVKIIEGLSFFRNYGVRKVWITHWYSEDSVGKGYSIYNRTALNVIREWLNEFAG